MSVSFHGPARRSCGPDSGCVRAPLDQAELGSRPAVRIPPPTPAGGGGGGRRGTVSAARALPRIADTSASPPPPAIEYLRYPTGSSPAPHRRHRLRGCPWKDPAGPDPGRRPAPSAATRPRITPHPPLLPPLAPGLNRTQSPALHRRGPASRPGPAPPLPEAPVRRHAVARPDHAMVCVCVCVCLWACVCVCVCGFATAGAAPADQRAGLLQRGRPRPPMRRRGGAGAGAVSGCVTGMFMATVDLSSVNYFIELTIIRVRFV